MGKNQSNQQSCEVGGARDKFKGVKQVYPHVQGLIYASMNKDILPFQALQCH